VVVTVGVTVGAATSSGGGGRPGAVEQLLSDADAAMYEAKARRRS